MVINPQSIEFYLPVEIVLARYGHPRRLCGLEINSDEIFKYATPIYSNLKIQYCMSHFIDNIAWDKLPIEDALIDRYEKLDLIFQKVQKDGCLQNISGDNILIHLFRDHPYFAGGGFHRLAIAFILRLQEIPVDISLIRR